MFYLVLYEEDLYLLELGVNADGCLLNVLEKLPNVEKKTNLVKRLLGCGADPNEESKNKKSILSAAIKRNLSEIAEELIKHGADVNFIDSNGVSPLGYAIQQCKSFLSPIIILVFLTYKNYHIFF